MKTSSKIVFFCFLSFLFISCDHITKDLAKQHLMNRGSISYLNGFFRLTYAENTGAAMSLGNGLPGSWSLVLLGILPLIFLTALLFYTIKNASKIKATKIFLLALIVSGGLGNITDRLINDRHVTDFMNLGIQNVRTGIFNFADVCITLGVLGFIFLYRTKSITS